MGRIGNRYWTILEALALRAVAIDDHLTRLET
jgi:hypothetical protein